VQFSSKLVIQENGRLENVLACMITILVLCSQSFTSLYTIPKFMLVLISRFNGVAAMAVNIKNIASTTKSVVMTAYQSVRL
jgi:hypothetical protein